MAVNVDYEKELHLINKELLHVESELQKLSKRKQELISKRDDLEDGRDIQKSEILGRKNWERSDFEWSDRLKVALNNVFNIDDFRPQQLSAMNATLSKYNAIVVMPTGAGKSLCFQLPAFMNNGITVVVSPLISLMEDQVMGLKNKGISSKLITSTSSKEATTEALNDLIDEKSEVKLLYVTPERFAKSKRFMAKLQKCFALGRLQRIAIDEVHCCSQWGHDFRPDYKFLGVLSAMFPGVPLLGLTATATSRVLLDVQKMLDIRSSVIIKSSFNRSNLFYQIIDKPSSSESCIEILEKLLKYRYKDQSGIIYATSIKDCEDLALGLRKKGLKVACYHASLESTTRSVIHSKWSQKYYQAVVATVAFGLGIDKPDVRFVIHHSLSKSMESYYQESGRAGRDGGRAECIMMYRMQDIFKVSTMVFSSAGSLDHLYGMLKYCLEPSKCRRQVISQHFDEQYDSNDCQQMCDRCCQSNIGVKEYLLRDSCTDIYKIIRWASQQDSKVTAQKLIDSWFGKGATNFRVSSVKSPSFSRPMAEAILVYLLVEGYLKEDFHYTAYSTISYIKIGNKSYLIDDDKHQIKMVVRNYSILNVDELAPMKLPKPKKSIEQIKSINEKYNGDLKTKLMESKGEFKIVSKRNHKDNKSIPSASNHKRKKKNDSYDKVNESETIILDD